MSDTMWETKLDGERIFSGRVVRLEVDRVQLPGGGESVREVIRHRGATVILPVLDDGRILMVRQHRYPVEEVLLELPAGTLEPDEDPLHCAARELVEETGHAARTITPLGRFYSAPGYTDEVLHAVLARDLEHVGAMDPDDDEHLELVVRSVDATFAMIATGEIRDAKTIATMMLAQLRGELNVDR
jgi:ADP-ribose pyrophosphatase